MKLQQKILILIAGLIVTSCGVIRDALEPHVVTVVDVSVRNNGSDDINTSAVAMQYYDANHCSPDFASQSNSVQVSPGQETRVGTSIQCNAKVRTYVRVSKKTNYEIGSIYLGRSALLNLRAGIPFRVTDRNRQNAISMQVVNAVSKAWGYDHVWSLSPTGAAQVGWVESSYQAGSSWSGILYFSLPKNLSSEMYFVEFDDSLGISDLGAYQVEHINGVYRVRLDKKEGPFITANMSNGTLVCDDLGCNEKNY